MFLSTNLSPSSMKLGKVSNRYIVQKLGLLHDRKTDQQNCPPLGPVEWYDGEQALQERGIQ